MSKPNIAPNFRAVSPVAQRKCVACGRKAEKSAFLRVYVAGQSLQLDLKGKNGGRGAYVCKNAGCIHKALAKRAFLRTLKTQLSAGDDLKTRLHDALE